VLVLVFTHTSFTERERERNDGLGTKKEKKKKKHHNKRIDHPPRNGGPDAAIFRALSSVIYTHGESLRASIKNGREKPEHHRSEKAEEIFPLLSNYTTHVRY
jgi:hypothetical protein